MGTSRARTSRPSGVSITGAVRWRGSQRPQREWGAEAPREDESPIAREMEMDGMGVEEGVRVCFGGVGGAGGRGGSNSPFVWVFLFPLFFLLSLFFGGYGEQESKKPQAARQEKKNEEAPKSKEKYILFGQTPH